MKQYKQNNVNIIECNPDEFRIVLKSKRKKDLAEKTYTNANLRKTNDYGVYLRYCAITDDGKDVLRRYYGKFGFECPPNESAIYDINSNKYANWVQFTGNYVIPDMDRDLFDVLHSLFESGVRLWHSYEYMAGSVDMRDNSVVR